MNVLGRAVAGLSLNGGRCACGKTCLPPTLPAVLGEQHADELIRRLGTAAACTCRCCEATWAEIDAAVAEAVSR